MDQELTLGLMMEISLRRIFFWALTHTIWPLISAQKVLF